MCTELPLHNAENVLNVFPKELQQKKAKYTKYRI
jgi:hypothetical protein